MRGARRLIPPLLVIVTLVVPASSPAADRDVVEPGVLSAPGTIGVLARFDRAIPADLDAIDGLAVWHRYTSIPAVAATATPGARAALAARDDLAYLEADKPIAFDLDSAVRASRAGEVWGGDAPLTDEAGAIIDGAGVGIAIVDAGLDGLHPDFEGRVGGNYEATPAGLVASPYTAAQSGHGTHVAGIAAGSGSVSEGRYRGVASGATLYGFKAVNQISFPAMVFDWILQHGADQDPPIRVVNNSWHCTARTCSHPFNPRGLHITLESQLAESGFTITWSAGNEQGDGETPTTNPEAINPTPGIIGVANYKDEDTGLRDRCLSSASSWGNSADPTTWPDVTAPGRSIVSTWGMGPYLQDSRPDSRNPLTDERSYKELTGTSMAAPHVAGLVALMLHANPALTPGEIEYIVKQTATPLTGNPADDGCGIDYINADPSHPWNGANYAAGHGLIDARAAVELALSFDGIPPALDPEPVPDTFIIATPGYRTEHVLYLTGDETTSTVYPDASRPNVRVFGPDGRLSHTSDPLPADQTMDALRVDLYLGSTSEARDIASVIGTTVYVAEVERIAPDGTASPLAFLTRLRESGRSLWPIHRDLVHPFDEPVTIHAGERLRVTVRVNAIPYQGVEPAVNGFWAFYNEANTPSRLEFTSRVDRPAPGTREACERLRWCAMVDELHPHEGLQCDDVPTLVTWRGPVGSMLVYGCNGVGVPCVVYAADPDDDWGSCEMEVTIPIPYSADEGGWCLALLPDGSRGGVGRCLSLERPEN